MNITYLFGAGASRNALPIVNEMSQRIHYMIDLLLSESYELSSSETFEDIEGLKRTKRQVQHSFIDDLKWLEQKCDEHASVDTFAKKLFLKGQQKELLRLKIILSAYLTLEQAHNHTGDKRYDAFYASLLSNSVNDFPSTIKIISWNYDFQFEKAYSDYSDSKEISKNQELLNFKTRHNGRRFDNGFGIYKINGTTGLYRHIGKTSERDEIHICSKFPEKFDVDVVEQVIENYIFAHYYKHIYYPTLSFAWEKLDEDDNIVSKCIQAAASTHVLIVIGYSFPFFNREIDRKIIGSMQTLQKVYFQSPDAEDVKERFLSVRADIPESRLYCRTNVSQFLLPD